MMQAEFSGPFAAFAFLVLVVIVYFIGTKLIDYHYKRKAEFVEDIQVKIKESRNAKSN